HAAHAHCTLASFPTRRSSDLVVGGYTKEKIALRRAIGMGYDTAEYIRVIRKGRAVPAQGPIPPDVVGYDPKLRTAAQLYDPAAADRKSTRLNSSHVAISYAVF